MPGIGCVVGIPTSTSTTWSSPIAFVRISVRSSTHWINRVFHVSVHRHVATLHGDVATEYAADRLEAEVRSVVGVVGVQSRLHVGLLPGDACPSDALKRSAMTPPNRVVLPYR